MKMEIFTWPPEKPTAMTPSSLPADRNLGEMVEGEVMVVCLLESLECRMMPVMQPFERSKRVPEEENTSEYAINKIKRLKERTNRQVRTVAFI